MTQKLYFLMLEFVFRNFFFGSRCFRESLVFYFGLVLVRQLQFLCRKWLANVILQQNWISRFSRKIYERSFLLASWLYNFHLKTLFRGHYLYISTRNLTAVPLWNRICLHYSWVCIFFHSTAHWDRPRRHQVTVFCSNSERFEHLLFVVYTKCK